MSTNEYFRLALLQYVKLQHNLESIQNAQSEVNQLRLTLAAKHKKHRRTDKEIEKTLQVKFSLIQCSHCQRIYASQVALRLHLKLKHREILIDKHYDSNTVIVSESDKEQADLNMEMI